MNRNSVVKAATEEGKDRNSRRLINALAFVAVLGVLVAGVAIWSALVQYQHRVDAGKSLAQQVRQACADKAINTADIKDLCKQAKDVEKSANSGPQGIPGLQGPEGRQGPEGVPGLQGPRGLQGPPGQDGKDGAAGREGASGKDGPEGPVGAQGQPGQDGAQGPEGPQGLPGQDGKDGDPGTARPGTYSCPDGQYVGGFTVADDGAVTLDCRALLGLR